MPTTRAEAETLYISMVAHARHVYSLDPALNIQPDMYAIASIEYAKLGRTSDITYQDCVRIASRAIAAAQTARDMRANPNQRTALGDIPRNRGLRTPVNVIEYRVVIAGLVQQGRARTREGIIIIRSPHPLSLAEVEALARRQIVLASAGHGYETRVPMLAGQPSVSVHVVAVSRYEA